MFNQPEVISQPEDLTPAQLLVSIAMEMEILREETAV